MKLSVIIPVFNEKMTVLRILERLKSVPIEKEIIIVDDYSTDGSRNLLVEQEKKDKSFKLLLHERNLGKGACIRTAQPHVSGDYIVIQDADLEQEPMDLLILLEWAEKEGFEAVFGTRILRWEYKFNIRFFANIIFSLVTNILYKAHLSDIMSGYKLISKNLFQSVNLVSHKFDIEPEITAKLLRKGVKIKEVPIYYNPRFYREGKKIRAKDSFSIIYCLFKERFARI